MEHVSSSPEEVVRPLAEHFGEKVPKDKLLYFLGAILEEASPAERQEPWGR